MKFHPAAEIFPMLTSLDMAGLAKSIREDGQKFPIIVHEDMILDGRNRWRACQIAAVKPWTEKWDGKGSPTSYVIACNLHRRQLTESQRAVVAARAKEMFEGEAANRKTSGKPSRGVSANLRSGPHKAAADAASLLNVSPRTVEHASRVLDYGIPELVTAVEQGEVSVSAASAVAKKTPDEQRNVMRAGPSAVVAVAREQRAPQKDNGEEILSALMKLWKRAGNKTRQKFMAFVEGS